MSSKGLDRNRDYGKREHTVSCNRHLSARSKIPDWLLPEPSSSPPPVDGFIAGRQDALFEAQQAEPATARAGFTRWETLSKPTVTRGTRYRAHSVAAGNQYATDGSQAPVGSL